MSMLIFKIKQKGKVLSPHLLQMRCCLGPSCVLGPWECQFTASQYYPPETEQIRIYSPFTPPPLPLTEQLRSTAACGRGKVRPAGHLFPTITGSYSRERNGLFFPSSSLVRKTKDRTTGQRGGTWTAGRPAGATT